MAGVSDAALRKAEALGKSMLGSEPRALRVPARSAFGAAQTCGSRSSGGTRGGAADVAGTTAISARTAQGAAWNARPRSLTAQPSLPPLNDFCSLTSNVPLCPAPCTLPCLTCQAVCPIRWNE